MEIDVEYAATASAYGAPYFFAFFFIQAASGFAAPLDLLPDALGAALLEVDGAELVAPALGGACGSTLCDALAELEAVD
jgi:hypothetical protein